MAKAVNPGASNNRRYKQEKAQRAFEKALRNADPEYRPDELQLRDERAADYERRKRRINNPFRTIIF